MCVGHSKIAYHSFQDRTKLDISEVFKAQSLTNQRDDFDCGRSMQLCNI